MARTELVFELQPDKQTKTMANKKSPVLRHQATPFPADLSSKSVTMKSSRRGSKLTAIGESSQSSGSPLSASQQNAISGKSRLPSWKAMVVFAILAGITTVVFPYVHIITVFAMSADVYGKAQAQAEVLREIYPVQMSQTVAAIKWIASSQNTYAQTYYEMERPNIIAAAKEFEMHPYFNNPDMVNAEPSWNGMLHQRMKYFRKTYEEQGRRDFDLEKDRCKMFHFFDKHGLPMLPLHGEWDDLSALKSDVYSGKAFQNVTDFPVFWKACHLTQGSAMGTRSMSSIPNASEKKELAEWFDEKWDFRAHDYERVWVEDGDIITKDIPAGFMLQVIAYFYYLS